MKRDFAAQSNDVKVVMKLDGLVLMDPLRCYEFADAMSLPSSLSPSLSVFPSTQVKTVFHAIKPQPQYKTQSKH